MPFDFRAPDAIPHPRPLPPPTLAALYPPIRGYRYFDAPEGWAFRPKASVDEVQQAWWLAEHALLAYERSAKVASTLSSTGYRAQIARDRASSSFRLRRNRRRSRRSCLSRHRGADTRRLLAQAGIGGTRLVDRCARATRAWRARRPRAWWLPARTGCDLAAVAGRTRSGAAVVVLRPQPWRRPGCAGRGATAGRWRPAGRGDHLRTAARRRCRQRGAPGAAAAVACGQCLRRGSRTATGGAGLPARRPVAPPGRANRRENYGRSVRSYWSRLPGNLRHGIGALTPIELIDHAPLHYVVKCFNAALQPENADQRTICDDDG